MVAGLLVGVNGANHQGRPPTAIPINHAHLEQSSRGNTAGPRHAVGQFQLRHAGRVKLAGVAVHLDGPCPAYGYQVRPARAKPVEHIAAKIVFVYEITSGLNAEPGCVGIGSQRGAFDHTVSANSQGMTEPRILVTASIAPTEYTATRHISTVGVCAR